MDISVEIKMVDEFGQVMTGLTKSENLDHECHTHLDAIFSHVKQAVSALGFSEKMINEYFNIEKIDG